MNVPLSVYHMKMVQLLVKSLLVGLRQTHILLYHIVNDRMHRRSRLTPSAPIFIQ